MDIDANALRNFSDNAPFVCLFSGGKDCAAAISIAYQYAEPMALIHYIDYNDGYVDELRTDVIRIQAEAMGILLDIYEGGRRSVRDIYKFAKILEKYAKKGAKYLVTGSIYDMLAYQINTEITSLSGMALKSPLWGMSDEEILDQIEHHQIKSIITQVDPAMLSIDWLGREFDRNAYTAFKNMGINPFGDEGEFDTTFIQADFFKKQVSYETVAANHETLELKLYLK